MNFFDKIHLRNSVIPLLPVVIPFIISGCTSSPRFVSGRDSGVRPPPANPASRSLAVEEGIASYYADDFNGRQTSNGEIYDMYALTAAHPSHPFNTRVRITNLNNGRSVVLRINDRGPFLKDRIIDVSYFAAKQLQMIGTGTAPVRVEVIEWGPAEDKPK